MLPKLPARKRNDRSFELTFRAFAICSPSTLCDDGDRFGIAPAAPVLSNPYSRGWFQTATAGSSGAAGRAASECEFRHSFPILGCRSPSFRQRPQGLPSTPIQGRSARSRRARPDGYRADRHRQGRRLQYPASTGCAKPTSRRRSNPAACWCLRKRANWPARSRTPRITARWRAQGPFDRRWHLGRQGQQLHRGTDILVATPDQLLDLIDQKAFTLDKVEVLVLDEAGRSSTSASSARWRISQLVPEDRQTLFFSATIPSRSRNWSANTAATRSRSR